MSVCFRSVEQMAYSLRRLPQIGVLWARQRGREETKERRLSSERSENWWENKDTREDVSKTENSEKTIGQLRRLSHICVCTCMCVCICGARSSVQRDEKRYHVCSMGNERRNTRAKKKGSTLQPADFSLCVTMPECIMITKCMILCAYLNTGRISRIWRLKAKTP